MKKTLVQLGKPYTDQTVNGWYASEKLDGIRALWVPKTRGVNSDTVLFSNDPSKESTGLWSRDGKIIHAPEWWLNKLSEFPLDGELFLDRKSFQQTMSYVRKKFPLDDEWCHIKYMAFDLPVLMESGKLEFKNRKVFIPNIRLNDRLNNQPIFRFAYEGFLSKIEHNDVLKVVKQTRVKDKNEVVEFMNEIQFLGGEGVMLRNPDTPWLQERTSNLLKVKPELELEVYVTGNYYYGDGKYYGMLGALEVCFLDGDKEKVFKLSGFTDEEREVKTMGEPFTRSRVNDTVFKTGQKIKITYREMTKDGIPKEARYKR